MHKSYPRWVYHFSADPKIVENQEERDALDGGWVESPALVKQPAAEEIPAKAELDGVKAKRKKRK